MFEQFTHQPVTMCADAVVLEKYSRVLEDVTLADCSFRPLAALLERLFVMT